MWRILLLSIAVLLPGCTANAIIRGDATLCRTTSEAISGPALSPCRDHSLEEVAVKLQAPVAGSAAAATYLLGFVEFDDEGKSWMPQQQDLVFDHMKAESDLGDISVVVFVHGWKHNAREDDGNVRAFVQLLEALTRAEQQAAATTPRRVIGIYAGWRGESGPPGLFDNLSFWTRKAAAQRVAEGGIRGLLGRVRAFRDTLNANLPEGRIGSRMLTIGHSFGGLIVYSALAEYFVDRAAEALVQQRFFPDAEPTDHARERDIRAKDRLTDRREIAGYGDLVVLVNPAFEAMRYDPIRELVTEPPRGVRHNLPFPPWQSPVLIEVTSVGDSWLEGDWATGIAFPIGRSLSTGLELTRKVPATGENEKREIREAVGHYVPFWTHDLNGPRVPPQDGALPLVLDRHSECVDLAQFEHLNRRGGVLQPGWVRNFPDGSVLTQSDHGATAPTNPFWVVRAHSNVMHDHDDIANPVFTDFITKIYQDNELLKDPRCRRLIDESR